MALCDECCCFDDNHVDNEGLTEQQLENNINYEPNRYYYWRDAFPNVDCMCEICFDIANEEKKIIWSDH